MNLRTFLLLPLIAVGCAPTGPYVKVEAINSYRAYGEYHPQAQDDAIVAKAA